jgi:hypothetical protein
LGQERSQVKELLSHLSAPKEESLFEELAAVLFHRAWGAGSQQVHPSTAYTLLTLGGQILGILRPCGHVYLVKLEPTNLEDTGAGNSEDRTPETLESIVPDTDRAYTVEQMARAWQTIGRPITEDDAALSIDPDDYPLF